MKHEIRWSCLTSVVLSWMLSAAAVGCMVTAFELEVTSFARLLLICGAVSVFSGVCFALRGGDVVLVGVFALAAGYLWHEGTAWSHIAALLRCITRLYDMAYGWGVVTLNGYDGLGPVDLALGIIGSLAAISVSWVVMRRRSVICSIPMTILPLVSCLVVTDTVPAAIWLYLLMLGLVVLLLTDYVRRREKPHAAWLTAYLALPVAAALGLLFLLVPQKSYVNHAGKFEEKIIAWAADLVDTETESVKRPVADTVGDPAGSEVDLSDVGPKSPWNYTVLEVTASEGGSRYLRGQDYDTYTGTDWIASSQRIEHFGGGTPTGSLTIRTRGTADVRYLPYYPAEAVTMTEGRLENGQNLTEYTFEYTTEESQYTDGAEAARYLALPEKTALWAEALAGQILESKEADKADAQAIADYVRGSARYSLNTPRMPDGEGDFARWFLEESDSGYCVHFATSTVVLLRAAGIPARYVTGYSVICEAGETVLVPEKAAHAWAEYYDGTCWQVLESTPASDDNTVPAETEEVTEPPETEEENTIPTEQTEPSRESQETHPPKTEEPQQQKPESHPKKVLPLWLKVFVLTLLLLAAVVGQSLLRRAHDRRLWNRGAPNRRAIARWLQVCRLARILGEKPPKELEELAQKARFSQHVLTEQELSAFRFWYQRALAQLRRRPLWQRLYYGILFALW